MCKVKKPDRAIDRMEPIRRPAGRRAMRHRWENLLFLHWRVPAREMQALLPPSLTLDTFQGDAYVGLVPFTMTGVRPIWAPAVRALSNFHETNVRTYVHREGRDPGVWFFSLDATNPAAVRIGRALWKLSYYPARICLEVRPCAVGENGMSPEQIDYPVDCSIDYTLERTGPSQVSAAMRLQYAVAGPTRHAKPGTLEHFLVERYILYAGSGERVYMGRVHHTPYLLQTAHLLSLEENLVAATGIRRPDETPLAHYASAVDADVYPLRRCAF